MQRKVMNKVKELGMKILGVSYFSVVTNIILVRARYGHMGPGNGPGVIRPPFSAAEHEGDGSRVLQPDRRREPWYGRGFTGSPVEGERPSPSSGQPEGVLCPCRGRIALPVIFPLALSCRPITHPSAMTRHQDALAGPVGSPSPMRFRLSLAAGALHNYLVRRPLWPCPARGYPASSQSRLPRLPGATGTLPCLEVTLPPPSNCYPTQLRGDPPSAGQGYRALPGGCPEGYPAPPGVALPPQLARRSLTCRPPLAHSVTSVVHEPSGLDSLGSSIVMAARLVSLLAITPANRRASQPPSYICGHRGGWCCAPHFH